MRVCGRWSFHASSLCCSCLNASIGYAAFERIPFVARVGMSRKVEILRLAPLAQDDDADEIVAHSGGPPWSRPADPPGSTRRRLGRPHLRHGGQAPLAQDDGA